MRKHINICLGLGAVLLILLLSACGNSSAATATATDHTHNQVTTTTSTLSNQSAAPTVHPFPEQLLKKSSQVMNHLRGVHFTVDAKRQDVTTASVTSSGPVASLLQALQPQGSRNTTNSWKQGEGDEDRASGNTQITLSEKINPPTFAIHTGDNFPSDQRMHGDTVYLLGGLPINQSWYVIKKQTLLNQTGTRIYAVSGMQQVRDLIDLAIKKGTLSDKGAEAEEGTTLRHIQVTLSEQDRTALRNIDVENYDSSYASIPTANTQGRIDFWIDEQTGYVSQLASTLVFQTTDSSMPAKTIQQTLVFTCSRFNQPVSIPLPQQAIPATSIDQIYPIIPS